MNLFQLFKKIWPYVRPYRWLVLITLILTLIGSLMAQVNAIVLDRTVDAVNGLVTGGDFAWSKAARILTIITIVLLGKEILSALITFAQSYYGEKMRIFVSKDLSQAVIDKMLTFRMAFFSRSNNDTGKLQTRIDQGVSSLSRTVQNFFIDLLPLFTSAVPAMLMKGMPLTVTVSILCLFPSLMTWIAFETFIGKLTWCENPFPEPQGMTPNATSVPIKGTPISLMLPSPPAATTMSNCSATASWARILA